MLGHEVQVETQGSAGTVPLSDDVIAAADGVIYAADLEVKGKARFAGKPFVDVGVKKAVHDGPRPCSRRPSRPSRTHRRPAPRRRPPLGRGGTGTVRRAAVAARKVGVGTQVRQWLMTGVSYMIPFVAAGGILIALGFLFGGDEVVTKLYGGTFDGVTYADIAGSVPAGFPKGQSFDTLLAAGRFRRDPVRTWARSPSSCWCRCCPATSPSASPTGPGLVPGIVGGLLAGVLGAGFLGGLVSGFAAGGVALLHDPAEGAEGCPRRHAGRGDPAGLDHRGRAVHDLRRGQAGRRRRPPR